MNKRSLIVLTTDNQYVRVKRDKRSYSIGDEIQFPAPIRRSVLQVPFVKPLLAGAACCVMLVALLPMFRTHSQSLPIDAYVSVDINPSIEIGVDSHLHVGTIHPFNADGSKVISQLKSWKNGSLQDVIHSIIQVSDEDGFLQGDRHVLICTNLVNQDAAFANSVNDSIEKIVKNEESKQHVTISTMKGSVSIRDTSKSLGVSEGKYLLYEQAKQRGINVSLQEIKENSISNLDHILNQASSIEIHHPSTPSTGNVGNQTGKSGKQTQTGDNSADSVDLSNHSVPVINDVNKRIQESDHGFEIKIESDSKNDDNNSHDNDRDHGSDHDHGNDHDTKNMKHDSSKENHPTNGETQGNQQHTKGNEGDDDHRP
jgi:Anti-sigma factor N-terminus